MILFSYECRGASVSIGRKERERKPVAGAWIEWTQAENGDVRRWGQKVRRGLIKKKQVVSGKVGGRVKHQTVK